MYRLLCTFISLVGPRLFLPESPLMCMTYASRTDLELHHPPPHMMYCWEGMLSSFNLVVVSCPYKPLCRNGGSSKTVYRPEHDFVLNARMLACGPPRCAYMTPYDSGMDNPMQGLSFRPTLMVLGALMLKRRTVQFRSFEISVAEISVIGRSTGST